ncbi:MAG: hypothetical protein JO048_11810 [Methylobacteriaceae bacterium]|nr:hypothetical protein [Methylobacteriaceae bacterium]
MLPRGPIALACCLALAWLVPSPSRAAALVGVNVVNPQWQPRGRQDATLDALREAGVRLIRVPLLPPTGGAYEDAVDYVARAAARGLDVLLVVYPQYRPDAAARPAVPSEPEMWQLPPLSAADPDLLTATYGPFFRRLDTRGLALAGIEFGNEINWTAFNGEFPIPGEGRILGDRDLAEHPVGRRIAAGFRAYLRSLAALRRLRDNLVANRRTPLLAAGFSDFGPPGPSPWGRSLDGVGLAATLRFLRAGGLDALVDGYSLHTYPEAGATPAARAAAFARDALAACSLGKPCWITEWGFPEPDLGCAADDRRRAALVEEFRDLVRPAVADGRIRGLVYYAWDGAGDPHALLRCGRLRASGRAALAPFGP